MPLDLIAVNEQASARQYDVNRAPNTKSELVEFSANFDKLLTQTIYIDDIESFKAQLELLTNDSGQPVDSVTVSPATAIGAGQTQINITAAIDGQPVLDIILISEQAFDGVGMIMNAQLKQYQALSHPIDPDEFVSTRYVNIDNGSIDIKVPIQVKDIDGSLLVDPQNSSLPLARLVTFSLANEVIFVKESGIGPDSGISDGSQSETDTNKASFFQNGQALTLDPYNERVGDDFYFSVYSETFSSIQLIDGSPLNAHDNTPEHPYLWNVFLHQISTPIDSYPKEYLATTNHDATGLEVFKIQLQQNGDYSFELLTSLHHNVADGNNLLEIELNAYSKDSSGDVSSNLRIPIVIEDDVPVKNTDIPIEIISNSNDAILAQIDVLENNIGGADGAAVTDIFNGIEWINVSTTRSSLTALYSSLTPHEQIGTVSINPRNDPIGLLSFTFEPNIIDNESILAQTIKYKLTDVDSDVAIGELNFSQFMPEPVSNSMANTSVANAMFLNDSDEEEELALQQNMSYQMDSSQSFVQDNALGQSGRSDDTTRGISVSGKDILIDNEQDNSLNWPTSNMASLSLLNDPKEDFSTIDHVIDISSMLPASIDANSTIDELLEHISAEITPHGLHLHISPIANGEKEQDITINDLDFADLGLSSGASESQILDQLLQLQALKID